MKFGTTTNRDKAAGFKVYSFGIKDISSPLALTHGQTLSLSHGPVIRMKPNTSSDNQYWNTKQFYAHDMPTAIHDNTLMFAPANGDDPIPNSMYQRLPLSSGLFEEVSTFQTLKMGVYTLYNSRYGHYLSVDPTPPTWFSPVKPRRRPSLAGPSFRNRMEPILSVSKSVVCVQTCTPPAKRGKGAPPQSATALSIWQETHTVLW